MGVVYEACTSRCTVARGRSRCLRGRLSRDQEVIRRPSFNEARATNEVRHPGIVAGSYDCGNQCGWIAVV